MRKPVVFGIQVCLVGCAVLCYATQSLVAVGGSTSAPPLRIEPEVLDFGRVNESEHFLELSFTIKNVSNTSVDISNIGSGCGCTAVNLSHRTLKSGEYVSVPVKVNVQKRRGDFEQNVQVNAAGYKESIVVPIRGKVVQDIWFEGPMIQCFAKESETMVERTFEIHTIDWHSV